MIRPPQSTTLFPYTTLFRSKMIAHGALMVGFMSTTSTMIVANKDWNSSGETPVSRPTNSSPRSEEHTSELQSHSDLVCRLLLEKKNKKLQSAVALPRQPSAH